MLHDGKQEAYKDFRLLSWEGNIEIHKNFIIGGKHVGFNVLILKIGQAVQRARFRAEIEIKRKTVIAAYISPLIISSELPIPVLLVLLPTLAIMPLLMSVY
jgi:hypothetical protein